MNQELEFIKNNFELKLNQAKEIFKTLDSFLEKNFFQLTINNFFQSYSFTIKSLDHYVGFIEGSFKDKIITYSSFFPFDYFTISSFYSTQTLENLSKYYNNNLSTIIFRKGYGSLINYFFLKKLNDYFSLKESHGFYVYSNPLTKEREEQLSKIGIGIRKKEPLVDVLKKFHDYLSIKLNKDPDILFNELVQNNKVFIREY